MISARALHQSDGHRMRRDQLPLVTLDGRHAGELLAHPCDCGRPGERHDR